MKTVLPLLYKDLSHDELIDVIEEIYDLIKRSSITSESQSHFYILFHDKITEIDSLRSNVDEEDIKDILIDEKEARDNSYGDFYLALLSINQTGALKEKQLAEMLLREIRYRNFSRELVDLRSEVHVLKGLVDHFSQSPFSEAISELQVLDRLNLLQKENNRLQVLLDRYHDQKLRPEITLTKLARQLYELYRMAKSYLEAGSNVLHLEGFDELLDEINLAIKRSTQNVRKRRSNK